MEGLNLKRMGIALVIIALFGVLCVYVQTLVTPADQITMPYLMTIFYNRLLLGFVIGLSGSLKLLNGELANAVLRGGIMGAIVSLGISFYGSTGFIPAGIVFGIITDLVATKFGS